MDALSERSRKTVAGVATGVGIIVGLLLAGADPTIALAVGTVAAGLAVVFVGQVRRAEARNPSRFSRAFPVALGVLALFWWVQVVAIVGWRLLHREDGGPAVVDGELVIAFGAAVSLSLMLLLAPPASRTDNQPT